MGDIRRGTNNNLGRKHAKRVSASWGTFQSSSIQLPFSFRRGKPRTVVIFRPGLTLEDTINWRAWTLQQGLLSQRCIFWGLVNLNRVVERFPVQMGHTRGSISSNCHATSQASSKIYRRMLAGTLSLVPRSSSMWQLV
jgi:hypothetical protein